MFKLFSNIFSNGKLQLFLAQKRGRVGLAVFVCLFLIAMFSPFISNDKPIFLYVKNTEYIYDLYCQNTLYFLYLPYEPHESNFYYTLAIHFTIYFEYTFHISKSSNSLS